MNEKWAPVVGYEGLYEINNYGQVRQLRDNYYVLQQTDVYGYKKLAMSINGVQKTFTVHRLVAMAFIPNPHNYPQINHLDENKTNNRADNLEWCTAKQNNGYGTKGKRQAETYKRNLAKRKEAKKGPPSPLRLC